LRRCRFVDAGCAGARTAQHGLDAGQQFARLERLGQVVVGADLQADDTVHHIAARGQHDDGRVAFAADRAAQFEAVHLGQPHIEDDGVEGLRPKHRQAGAGACGARGFDLETFEEGRQWRGQPFVVVDQQNAAHGSIVAKPRRLPLMRDGPSANGGS